MTHGYNFIKIKRVYEGPDNRDGCRILVDRFWPRGLSKGTVKLNVWLKDIAPSNELRKWFAHEANRWDEFKERYFRELDDKKDSIELVLKKLTAGTVTLLYGAKDGKLNNAVALKEYIETKIIGR